MVSLVFFVSFACDFGAGGCSDLKWPSIDVASL